MALPKIGFNEGSLLRRTLLHVVTFVVGAVAFVGIASFVLVSVARGLSPRAGDAAVAEADDADPGKPGKPGAMPGMKPLRPTKKTSPITAERTKDE